MAREARRLRDLVSELLDAQRLEQGLAVMNLAPADLGELVEAVRARHAEHGVPLILEEPDEALVVSVDRPRLEQVIENLLENAYKYGADDEPPALRIWHEGAEARIAVIDHGAGIPDGERERIFERFYRARERAEASPIPAWGWGSTSAVASSRITAAESGSSRRRAAVRRS